MKHWKYSKELSAIVTVKDHKVVTVADFGKVDDGQKNAKYIMKAVKAYENPDIKERLQLLYNDTEMALSDNDEWTNNDDGFTAMQNSVKSIAKHLGIKLKDYEPEEETD